MYVCLYFFLLFPVVSPTLLWGWGFGDIQCDVYEKGNMNRIFYLGTYQVGLFCLTLSNQEAPPTI